MPIHTMKCKVDDHRTTRKDHYSFLIKYPNRLNPEQSRTLKI